MDSGKDTKDPCAEARQECNTIHCPYGKEAFVDDQDCERCRCVDPCRAQICPDGTKCAITLVATKDGTEYKGVCRSSNYKIPLMHSKGATLTERNQPAEKCGDSNDTVINIFVYSNETRSMSKCIEQHQVRARVSHRCRLQRRNEVLRYRLWNFLSRTCCWRGSTHHAENVGHLTTGWSGTSFDTATGRATSQRAGRWLCHFEVRGAWKPEAHYHVEKGHDFSKNSFKIEY